MEMRAHFNLRLAELKQARSSFEPQWRDSDEYILPGSVEFNTSDTNRGERKNQKIINDTATDASRTLSSGLMGGLTSPARPWFALRTGNSEANQLKPVKVWTDITTKRMAEVFQRSNLYQVLPQFYDDLGSFATGAFYVEEDEKTTIRCYHLPVGSYYLGTSYRGSIDTCVREIKMTAHQMVEKFGYDQCTETVKNASKRNEDAWFEVVHFIEPNPDHDPNKMHSKFKRFRSVFYEPSNKDGNLSEMGYDEFPVIAARWSVRGSAIYGNRCPGFQCIGDVKALQLGEKKGWQGLEKMVDPPVMAPSGLRMNSAITRLPGGITWYNANDIGQGIKPLYEVNPRLAELDVRLARVEARIRRAYFADLFLMISNMDGIQPRNTAEINVRREEKMLMLGPVLERLNDEAFDPLIQYVFSIMVKRNMIPIPPPEIQDQELTIEYVSTLAQAQKLIGTAALEKLTAFVGNLMATFSSAGDKYDADQAIDEYAAMVGAGPKTIRDAKETAGMRQERAQAQAQDRMMMQAQQVAQTAQALGNTPVNQDTALGPMLTRMGLSA